MRFFICVVRRSGEPVTPRDCEFYGPAGQGIGHGTQHWTLDGSFAALTGRLDTGAGPSVTRHKTWIGVGDVRLDNRSEVLRLIDHAPQDYSDLELALAVIARRGTECVPSLLGDFSLVAWNMVTHDLIAVRDAFGQRGLYFVERSDCLVLSSRASLLAQTGAYNPEFIADFLAIGANSAELSPFDRVTTVPSGSMMVSRQGGSHITRYWSPEPFLARHSLSVADQVDTFRSLLTEGVRTRLPAVGTAWAQLSGGLDSSSVVCLAQQLARDGAVPVGLGGVQTMVDHLGDGDEREFSHAVVQRYQVRAEHVENYWLWQEDGWPPPRTEALTVLYPFYARDRRCCDLLRAGGAEVLLTGIGGDECCSGVPNFFADLISAGRWREAAHELTQWAVVTRTSFWHLAFFNALIPLLPAILRRGLRPSDQRVPGWIQHRFAKSHEMHKRHAAFRFDGAPRGRKFAGGVASQLEHYGGSGTTSLFDELFDYRHPFLHRPLVEFCLGLAPELRVHCEGHKRILREALRGILPEVVRRRPGKGGVNSRIVWSFVREAQRVNWLLDDPILSQLGCVDPKLLRVDLEDIRAGRRKNFLPLLAALSLETWLRVRVGRWTSQEYAASRASSPPNHPL